MIVIYAEKPDMGTKIAAALDGIHLKDGRTVSFQELSRYETAIKQQRQKDGMFRIQWLGQSCEVIWGYGHMCELKQAQDYDPSYRQWRNIPLPYIPERYDLKLIRGGQAQYQKIRDCFLHADFIICATDNDREGDLIFDYLYRYMHCHTPFLRAIFNKQSQEEFRKAFSKDKLVSANDRMPVIQAGRARSAGDFVVGADLTVAMSLKYPGSGVLSVGRVQTATLNLIYEREQAIRNFQPQNYYEIGAAFTDGSRRFTAVHEKKRFPNLKEATAVLEQLKKIGIGRILEVQTKKSIRKRPYLYNLQALQMDANKRFGFSLDQTLSIAQSLYEKGYTTYPRTDSMQLPEDMGQEMRKVFAMMQQHPDYARLIPNSFSVPTQDKKYFNNKNVESHYAITPTSSAPLNLSAEEKKVYDLIARVTIAMLYKDATVGLTTIVTKVGEERFLTKGTKVIDPGFFQVIGTPKEVLLPDVRKDEIFRGNFHLSKKQTEPPKHYTDASLLNAMMTCGKNLEDEELRSLMAKGPGGRPRGLGRPSSQAGIVATLLNRKYIEKKKTTILITPRGRALIELFPVADLKSAEMTAMWEKRLDDIEHGEDSYSVFMEDLENSVRKWTNQVISIETSTKGAEALSTKDASYEPKEKYRGVWTETNREVSFTRQFGDHRFTDEECEQLLQGESLTLTGLHRKDGSEYGCTGKLKTYIWNKVRGVRFEVTDWLSDKNEDRPEQERVHGLWVHGSKKEEVSFFRNFKEHRFTDEEVEQLLAGKTIEFYGLHNSRGEYGVMGALGKPKGKKYVSFQVEEWINC